MGVPLERRVGRLVNEDKELTMSKHYKTSAPQCPHCDHAFTYDEMLDDKGAPNGETDLFSLAPMEERRAVECPVCDREFWLEGSYEPRYTSAFAEEDL